MRAPLTSSTVYIAARGAAIARYVAPCAEEPSGSLYVSSAALDDMRQKMASASRSDVVDPWTLTSARLLADDPHALESDDPVVRALVAEGF